MTRTIGLLIFPRFQLLDAAGPVSAFEIASRFAVHGQSAGYDLRIMAMAPGAVASSSGVRMHAETIDRHLSLDTLVIAGGDGVREAADDPATIAYVQQAAAGARRVASVCSGAFVLATAGLLDGRQATTHWNRSKSFARAFPAVDLEPDRIFVRDSLEDSQGVTGREIWTSAGITAGIDMTLAMIGEDLGEAIARSTAQQLVVHHRRPGGQSQFSALLELQGGRFDDLLAWAREHLAEPLTVDQLAGRACMSPRNFARAFTAQSGVTPAKAVEQLRIEAARALLDSAPLCVEDVALEVGFGDPERMRRAFLRAFGLPPQALRRAAKAA